MIPQKPNYKYQTNILRLNYYYKKSKDHTLSIILFLMNIYFITRSFNYITILFNTTEDNMIRVFQNICTII